MRKPSQIKKTAFRTAEDGLATVATGVLLLLLWFLLPQTPVLSTFGFPQSVEDIQSPKRLLQYLQDYNKALVRTTTVLNWFIFVFVGWFLTAIYALSKALSKVPDAQPEKSSEKPVASSEGSGITG
jgi:predicted membrane-bound dolichyl-phosphate-mannose-protein mannosyltransferase